MKKIYNYFLVKHLEKDYVEFAHAKLILHFCLVTSVFSIFYAGIAGLIDFEISSLLMPIMAILYLGLAFSMRSKINLDIVSLSYLVLSFIAAIILIIHSGMIYSSIVSWLAFIPMAANLIGNKKAAIGWLIICAISVFVIMGFSPSRELVIFSYNQKYDALVFAMVYNGLIGIILLISMVFKKSKDIYLQQLQEKNELISSINKELKSKNDELIHQKEETRSQREFIEIKNRELLNVQNELNNIIEKLTVTQAILGNREAENRSILEAIYGTQLLVVEIDMESTFTRISSETLKFLKVNKEQVIGKKFEDFRKIVDLSFENSLDFDSLWEGILNGQHSSQEVSLKIGNVKHWFIENFFPILDENGNTVKVMVVAQDISQIRNQKDKIEALNNELTNKIHEIERQNSLLIYQRKEIEEINQEISKSNMEIKNINSSLERRVHERTKNLEEKNQQLAEYAYINSHLLRAPLCSILGLVNLLETDSITDHEKIVFHIRKSSNELHDVVNKITKAIEDDIHFDRKLLSDN